MSSRRVDGGVALRGLAVAMADRVTEQWLLAELLEDDLDPKIAGVGARMGAACVELAKVSRRLWAFSDAGPATRDD
jgi:hypothetical protein